MEDTDTICNFFPYYYGWIWRLHTPRSPPNRGPSHAPRCRTTRLPLLPLSKRGSCTEGPPSASLSSKGSRGDGMGGARWVRPSHLVLVLGVRPPPQVLSRTRPGLLRVSLSDPATSRASRTRCAIASQGHLPPSSAPHALRTGSSCHSSRGCALGMAWHCHGLAVHG